MLGAIGYGLPPVPPLFHSPHDGCRHNARRPTHPQAAHGSSGHAMKVPSMRDGVARHARCGHHLLPKLPPYQQSYDHRGPIESPCGSTPWTLSSWYVNSIPVESRYALRSCHLPSPYLGLVERELLGAGALPPPPLIADETNQTKANQGEAGGFGYGRDAYGLYADVIEPEITRIIPAQEF